MHVSAKFRMKRNSLAKIQAKSQRDAYFAITVICDTIQLFPEGEVNSGGYIPRREASRYISTALHRPSGR